MSTKTIEFNWELYENGYTGGSKLIPNPKIKGSNQKNKVFSREPYAQKLFDIYTNQETVVKKDLSRGDCVLVTDIFNIKDTEVDIEVSGGLSLTIDLNREKKFVQIFGFDTVEDFTSNLTKEYIKKILDENILVYVIETFPSIKVSLWQGYLMSIRKEFMEQINNPSKAYTAKIIEANKGGFFVEVQGIEAFMPGSLAAPNKIINFESFVGDEVIVMIEDFLNDMNSFIVSHKKYLSHILPQKISELDKMKKYVGTITGTSKYGIFIEFDEIFTGLLHVSKMNENTKSEFQARKFKAGDEIEFYIGEVTKDNRIILTEEHPEFKIKKIQKFILEYKDKIIKSSVAAIMNFGIIVDFEEITGLIPLKEFKKYKIFKDNYVVGDSINVIFDEYKNDKIIFKIPEE